jgi:hypothetical protein
MTELDDLKAALHEPPDFAPRPLDLAAVMSTGGRIRRRRRLAVGAAGALAVLVLLVGGNAVLQRPDTGNGTVAAATETVVRTGIEADDGEWVLYAKPVVLDGNPDVTFGVMLGRSIAGGEPVDAVMSNEVEGSGLAPGFHAVEGRMDTEAGTIPTFGYYAGPAVKITAEVDGVTVTLDQAALSDGIQVFWVAGDVKDLTAYDSEGRKLPEGNNTPGVG